MCIFSRPAPPPTPAPLPPAPPPPPVPTPTAPPPDPVIKDINPQVRRAKDDTEVENYLADLMSNKPDEIACDCQQ